MFCPKCGKEIPDESKFCPFCGEKILPGEKAPEQPSEPVPAPKKSNRKLILIPVIAVVIAAAVLTPYLVKQNGYKKLYNQAVSELNAGKYFDAADTILQLMEVQPEYEGADELLSEAVRGESEYLVQSDDYLTAIEVLTVYQELDDSLQGELERVQSSAHDRAVELYREKDYERSVQLFTSLPPFPDSNQYCALLMLHLEGDELETETLRSCYLALREDLTFEDTKEVLVSFTSIARRFLIGKWETSDGQYFFQGQGDHCVYNLPSDKFDTYIPDSSKSNSDESGINWEKVWKKLHPGESLDNEYKVNDGFYTISNGVEEKTLFKITVVSKDKINIYCYKDGMTYQMTRTS